MKVLSLKEPFATLIKDGQKMIETRSWKTNYRGEIYIHASMSKIEKKWQENTKLMKLIDGKALGYGYIICKCTLIDCIYMTQDFVDDIKKNHKKEFICGEYAVGRYAWILDKIEVLKNPIHVKG